MVMDQTSLDLKKVDGQKFLIINNRWSEISVMGKLNCVWFGSLEFSSINTAASLHDI